jgi:hypothetical protein
MLLPSFSTKTTGSETLLAGYSPSGRCGSPPGGGDPVVQFFQQRRIIRIRQVRIQDHQVQGFVMVNPPEHLPTVFGQTNPVALGRHFAPEELPDMGVAVRNQDGG